nr:hypothetical protein [Paracoccus sp. (in: a-proteobacteria)]
MRMAGVVVVDGDPIEFRAEVGFHLFHEIAGVGCEVRQLRAVLGRDDESQLMAVVLAAIKEGVAVGAVLGPRIELAALSVARCSVTLDIAQMRAGTAALPCGPDAALLDDHTAAARLAMMPVAGYVAGAHEARAPASLHALAAGDHGAGPPRR